MIDGVHGFFANNDVKPGFSVPVDDNGSDKSSGSSSSSSRLRLVLGCSPSAWT